MLNFSSPLTDLKRVGEVTAKQFAKLGVKTAGDLLFYPPFRYEDFATRRQIADLKVGETVNVIGTIDLIQNRRSARRRLQVTEALIRDDTGFLNLIWFNQGFLTRNLKIGDLISVAGRVQSKHGTPQISSPDYEKIGETELMHTSGLVPHYPSTAKLSQKQIRQAVAQVLPLAKKVADWVPADMRQRLDLLELKEALVYAHRPDSPKEAARSRERLAFSDLFLKQLKSQSLKKELASLSAIAIPFQEEATRQFVQQLPFTLTADQKKSAWEIIGDLKKEQPMSRLLEGDVGSGKTVVAALALLNVILANRQGVVMAPTEVLAKQHYHTFKTLFHNHPFRIALHTANFKEQNFEPKNTYQEADLVIGTHALIQPGVDFPRLSLAIIDEQHRFGVEQRHKITGQKNQQAPHFLSMTATPIPRSLALTIYGDLDLSIINQLPAGRKKIETILVKEGRRKNMEDLIRQETSQGRQVFVICPLIDASDKLEAKSATSEYKRLQEDVFPDLKVGLLHGRLKGKDKEKVLAEFADKKINILVATSVIEVGIDFPNATVMVIEGADRFGLAQLHQFRGRVGRSDLASYCFLVPSQENLQNLKTLERLTAVTEIHNGLLLAEKDLELRGGGDLYGKIQSGFEAWQLGLIFNHQFLKQSRDEAKNLIEDDPNLDKHPAIKAKLSDWEKHLHLE